MLGIMVDSFQSPAQVTYWLITGRTLFLLLNLLGLACFFYIAARRILPLMRSQRDSRFDRPLVRLERLQQFWLGQWKHPRYRTAGTIHILIFAGFLTLATQAFSLLILGVFPNFVLPGSSVQPCINSANLKPPLLHAQPRANLATLAVRFP
jgi:hypothetical protein